MLVVEVGRFVLGWMDGRMDGLVGCIYYEFDGFVFNY